MTRTVGIIHPGAMGIAVAQTIKNGRNAVLWAADGRSMATRQRATAADLTEVATLGELCGRAEIIVCVCPPDAAAAMADAVIAARFQGI